jgi:hypothetical protein
MAAVTWLQLGLSGRASIMDMAATLRLSRDLPCKKSSKLARQIRLLRN